MVKSHYVGRFAPSPTGPLHFGSLVAALASYLDARHHNGVWKLRIEDLDPPREQADAPGMIIEQLRFLGLHWDDQVQYQSNNLQRYQACLDTLAERSLLFECVCSRKSFAKVYPGRCRGVVTKPQGQPSATRIQVTDDKIEFQDLIQGPQVFDLAADIGDYILKRKDGLFAYQLAVVVDDHDQDITHVIRGSDLLDSTPRQQYLARQLGFHEPKFGHVPVMAGADGHKLSKQTKARAISAEESNQALKLALQMLNQDVPDTTDNRELLSFAVRHWSIARVPNQLSAQSPLI